MIFTKQEKGQPLNYQEADNNYIELRDVVSFVVSQTSQVNNLDQDVDDIVIGIKNLQNNYLSENNNLNDLNSFTTARNILDVYSKLQKDNVFLDISSNLTNIQDANTVRNNLSIGTNALRDLNIEKLNDYPTPAEGDNGDIWADWGILISNDFGNQEISGVEKTITDYQFQNINFIQNNDLEYKEFEYIGERFLNIETNGSVNYQELQQETEKFNIQKENEASIITDYYATRDSKNTNQVYYYWDGEIVFSESTSSPTKTSPQNAGDGGDGYYYFTNLNGESLNRTDYVDYPIFRYKKDILHYILEDQILFENSVFDLKKNNSYSSVNNDVEDLVYADEYIFFRDSLNQLYEFNTVTKQTRLINFSTIIDFEPFKRRKLVYLNSTGDSIRYIEDLEDYNPTSLSGSVLINIPLQSGEKAKTLCTNDLNTIFIFTDQGRILKYSLSSNSFTETATINASESFSTDTKPVSSTSFIMIPSSIDNKIYRINQSTFSITELPTNSLSRPYKLRVDDETGLYVSNDDKISKISYFDANLFYECNLDGDVIDFDITQDKKVLAITKDNNNNVHYYKLDENGAFENKRTEENNTSTTLGIAAYPGKYGGGFWYK